jgi:hypothetical protein
VSEEGSDRGGLTPVLSFASNYAFCTGTNICETPTLPLIRYEMSDSVRPATSPYCPCGRLFALIDGVQG